MKKRSSLVGAVVVALAGIAVGLASAAMMNRAHPPAVARFPARGSYGFTFRYPASWRRVACRLTDGSFLSTPITLPTTTRSISACRQSADLRLGPQRSGCRVVDVREHDGGQHHEVSRSGHTDRRPGRTRVNERRNAHVQGDRLVRADGRQPHSLHAAISRPQPGQLAAGLCVSARGRTSPQARRRRTKCSPACSSRHCVSGKAVDARLQSFP